MSVKEYNPAVYNLLGDLKVTAKSVTIQDICSLGKIIRKYNYSDKVCAVIAHRHFDLDENEVMYEVIDSERRIAEPRAFCDVLIDKAQPNLLSCGRDGAWYPVGYEESDEIFTAWNDTAFLAEAAMYLLDNNLSDKLALASRQLVEEKRNGDIYVEENLQESRQSITRLSSEEEVTALNGIPTTYSVDQETPAVDFICIVCM